MEFSAYQRAASETSSILNVYKKYLRDGIDLAANREFLRGELGDLLWYTAAVATACGLDLEDIVQANLARTKDRYPRQQTGTGRGELPAFDAGCPDRERFPRRLAIAVTEQPVAPGRRAATLTLVSAEPNAFPQVQLGRRRVRGRGAGHLRGGRAGRRPVPARAQPDRIPEHGQHRRGRDRGR